MNETEVHSRLITNLTSTFMLRNTRSELWLTQVERQIDQMVKFIKQEAEEKANEISVSAEEVCSVHRDTDQSNCLCMHPSQKVEQLCVPFILPLQERRGCPGTLMTTNILPEFTCSALNCCVCFRSST